MKKIPSSKYVGPVRECQICGNKKLTPFLSLGHQPVVQEYLTKERLLEAEATYPLALVFCGECGLTQLGYVVPPEIVFPRSYPYRTGLTNMLIRNFKQLAETLEEMGDVTAGKLIVDIGSNDGSLLVPFKAKGMKVVGVEPTDAADVANKNKLPTLKAFFDKKSAAAIVKKYGKAKIVTATNVFAHINDTNGLVRNVKSLMTDDGVFVSESQYLMDIVEKLQFDTVYHEHLRFYGLKPLVYLFKKAGMSVVDAERISAAGGSIRVYAKKGNHPMSKRVKELVAAEEKAGLYDMRAQKEFAEKVAAAKRDLMTLLFKIKKSGARVVGLTSSARSNSLLGYMRIYDDVLEYNGEKSGSPKIGMYTPGTHIPVVDEARIIKDQPEYVLVLSWHIGMELIKITKAAGYKGKFIIPLPKPRLVK